jgi:preprotein translocase subunit SecE
VAKSKSSVATTTTRDENAVVRYLKETRAELRKVTWPTRQEARTLTTIIVIVTVAMAIFLGTLDYIFQIVSTGVISGDIIRIGLAIVMLIGGAAAFYLNGQQE